MQFNHQSSILRLLGVDAQLRAHRYDLLVVVAAEHLCQRPRRVQTMLMEVRVLHRLKSVLANVGEVGGEDAAKEVRDLGTGDELEEARGGVEACSFAARGVGALCERVEGEGELEEWVAKNVGREELA